MLEQNRKLFDAFRKLHDEYQLDQDSLQERFNSEGEKVMGVVREWENKLCMQSEKGGFGKYTSSLAEKFREEVRKVFPMIDYVGIKIKPFSLKKIQLT